MVIGAPGAGSIDTADKVASKYPRVTRNYLDARGLRTEVVTLGGSVELAAVLHLTSHVVDLVETGETARVHHLELQETIAAIAPRLIIGRNVYRTESARIRTLIGRLEASAAREAAAR
jgi:ATP phosphoribosyltransferase